MFASGIVRDLKESSLTQVYYIRSSQAIKIVSVVAKSPAQRRLLWLKISLPLIGDTGNVLKKESITHMDKPASPIAA